MNKSLVIALIPVGLMGCAGLGMMGGMDASQIAAAVKDKSSMATCTDYTGAGGKFSVLLVNNDQTQHTGGGKTTVKCAGGEVTYEDNGKAASTSKVTTPASTTIMTGPAAATPTK